MTTNIIRDLTALRETVAHWKSLGETVGVVPTMGALHPGHLSLVEAAKKACDRVIVTIFVNPKQFNKPQDLANYPCNEQDDVQKLEPLGVDAIYMPDGETVYPEGFTTTVQVAGLTDCMDGVFRPGHFDGVTTVVAKLFLQTQADFAYFGEKDFQQVQVVRRMAADLDIPISVVCCPTIRQENGLALSSRNALLSGEQRGTALGLIKALRMIKAGLVKGIALEFLRKIALSQLKEVGFDTVEYLELRAADDLSLLDRPTKPARLFCSAWLGDVRLIDNIAVPETARPD